MYRLTFQKSLLCLVLLGVWSLYSTAMAQAPFAPRLHALYSLGPDSSVPDYENDRHLITSYKQRSKGFRFNYITNLGLGLGYSQLELINTLNTTFKDLDRCKSGTDEVINLSFVELSYTVGNEGSLTFGFGVPASKKAVLRYGNSDCDDFGDKADEVSATRGFVDLGALTEGGFQLVIGYTFNRIVTEYPEEQASQSGQMQLRHEVMVGLGLLF